MEIVLFGVSAYVLGLGTGMMLYRSYANGGN
jgi:hypothetical protein